MAKMLSTIAIVNSNYSRGIKLRQIGLYSDAIALFEKILINDATNLFVLYQLAECMFQISKYEEARNIYSQILLVLSSPPEKDTKQNIQYEVLNHQDQDIDKQDIKILFIEANIQLILTIIAQEKFALASQKIKKLQIIARKLNESKILGLVEYASAFLIFKEGDYQKAKTILEKCIPLIEELPFWEAKSLLLLGILSRHYGNLDYSMTYLQQSRQIFENLHEFCWLADSLSYLSQVYLDRGDYKQAKNSLYAVHDFILQTENNYKKALTLMNLGIFHVSIGDYSVAEQNFLSSKELWEKLNEKSMVGIIFCRMAKISKIYEHEKSRVDLYKKGLSLVESHHKDPAEYGMILLYGASIEVEINKIVNANEYLLKVERLIMKYHIGSIEPLYYLIKAQLEFNNNNFGFTNDILVKAAESANRSSQRTVMRRIYLYQVDILLKNYFITYNQFFLEKIFTLMKIQASFGKDYPVNTDYIHFLIIEAELAYIDLDYKKTYNLLQFARSICESKGFIYEKSMINTIYDFIKIFEKIHDLPGGIEDKISKFKHHSKCYPLNYEDFFANIQGIIYIMTERGMEPYISTQEITPDKEPFHIELSAMLSFTIGQGQNYNEGLFGPLPAPHKIFDDKSSLLAYAKSIKDYSALDPRFKDNTYALIVIAYPKRLEECFPHRSELKGMYDRILMHVTSKSDLNISILENLIINLISLVN